MLPNIKLIILCLEVEIIVTAKFIEKGRVNE
jgi:hypothetical protein